MFHFVTRRAAPFRTHTAIRMKCAGQTPQEVSGRQHVSKINHADVLLTALYDGRTQQTELWTLLGLSPYGCLLAAIKYRIYIVCAPSQGHNQVFNNRKPRRGKSETERIRFLLSALRLFTRHILWVLESGLYFLVFFQEVILKRSD